jgi:hypothetical protein
MELVNYSGNDIFFNNVIFSEPIEGDILNHVADRVIQHMCFKLDVYCNSCDDLETLSEAVSDVRDCIGNIIRIKQNKDSVREKLKQICFMEYPNDEFFEIHDKRNIVVEECLEKIHFGHLISSLILPYYDESILRDPRITNQTHE